MPLDVVHRVVEVNVDVIGLQALQASLQRGHHRVLRVGGAGERLRSQEDLVALALERVADNGLRLAAGVGFGGVEIIDSAIERVPDQVFIADVEHAPAE